MENEKNLEEISDQVNPPVEAEKPQETEKVVEEAAGAAAPAAGTPEGPVTEAPEASSKDVKRGKKKKRMSTGKKVLITFLILALFAGAVVGAFLYMANQYTTKYIKGTKINGVDVSDMTAEQVDKLIKTDVEDYDLTVEFPDGTKETLTAEDIGLTYDSKGNAENILANQNKYDWFKGYFDQEFVYNTTEASVYSKAKLRTAFEALPEMQEENITISEPAYMSLDEDGYIKIEPEVYGNEPDEYKVLQELFAAVESRNESVTLDESYYIQPELLADDKDLVAVAEDTNGFLDTTYTWDLHDGTTYTIDRSVMKDWLVTNEEEYPYYYVSEAEISKHVIEIAKEIAEKENVSYSTQTFHTTLRGDISIPAKNYGYTVDVEEEADQTFADIMARGQYERKPVYSRTPATSGLGNTYIEVDINNQHVYMYVNGKVVVDSLCVTGTETDASRRSDRGLFYVYRMHKNYTMRGPGYTSFVNYATFYNGGEALHDASWRSSFGGSTYMYSGSHGCINMPYGNAQAIYNNAFIGCPVVVF